MASRTQMRLQQLTGSVVDIKAEAQQYVGAAAVTALTGSDVQDIFGMIGAALNRLHGAASDEPFNNPAGTIRSGQNNAAAIKLHADAGAAQTIQLVNDEGTGANAIDLEASAGGIVLTSAASKTIKLTNADDDLSIVMTDGGGAAANEKIQLTNTNGTGTDAIELKAAAGDILINVDTAAKKLHVDSEGLVDIDAVKGITITNAADAAAGDITIEQTGANDSSVIITAAGTGTDAIKIDATAGDMVIGPNLADGKTLKLGKNGAVEVNIAPHGTPANELFSVTNTAGTADNAVELDAVAGGIKLEAAKSIHLESEEAEADSIQISAKHDSGGIDLMVGGTPAVVVSIDADSVDIAQITNIDDTTQSTSTSTGALIVDGGVGIAKNLNVGGDLNITGDISYTYVTSSIVEFLDPMLVTNAIDTTSNTGGLQIASASFAHALTEIEGTTGGAENSFDYGVIWKRSVGYDSAAGAYISAAVSSLFPGEENNESHGYDGQTDGNPFAVFKTVQTNTHFPGDSFNRDKRVSIGLDVTPRSTGVNPADLLGAMKGAYVILSSSDAGGKKSLGLIVSSSNSNNNVEIQVLGSGDAYGGFSQNTDNFATTNFAVQKGSIQLLNAYAGTMFNKLDSTFHMAAAAITGSGDNNIISGSANILQYGGVAAGKFNLFSNNIISGSTEILNIEYSEEDSNIGQYVIVESKNSRDLLVDSAANLILSASTAIKFVTNDNTTFTLPSSDGSSDHVLRTNGSGVLSFSSVSSLVSAEETKVAMKVKSGVTISAGQNNLLLTGSAAASSQILAQLHAGLDGDITNNSGFTGLTPANLNDRLDVYVNGQLLTSASKPTDNMPLDGTDGDYHIMSISPLSGTFAFDLESDDIITLTVR